MPHPDPDQLALAALPAEPTDPTVVAHLSTCRLCRDHVDALRRTVDLARAGSPHDGDTATDIPPDRIRQAIFSTITPDDAPTPLTPPRHRRTTALLVAGAVLTAALTGALAGWAIGQERAEPTIVASTELTALPSPTVTSAPGTSTAAMTEDGRLQITLPGPVQIPPGSYLEVWLADRTVTDTVPLGVIPADPRGGPTLLAMPPGLPDQHFTTLDISLEPTDGDGGHSGLSVLRASLP